MAMGKGIDKADPEKGQAVQSVTEVVPDEADSTSAPNKLPEDVNRPPVSTNKPDVPIAHSLIAGAGAPTGEPDYHPELGPDQEADYGAQAAQEASVKAEEKK
jgi:hypothetical protein